MGEINPLESTQPTENIPNPSSSSSSSSEQIPIIDLSSSSSNNNNIILEEIKQGCEEWGFFQVVNHGVPSEITQRVELECAKFFALPIQEKRKVCRNEENPLGYYDSEHTKNVRDWKEIFDFTVVGPTLVPRLFGDGVVELSNQWPRFSPDFRVACEEYAQEMVKLSFKLLELIALSLGLPANRFNGYFKDHTSFVRINHYPPCPFPHLALGVGPHKDAGALTILAQDDVGGLQVKRKTDGEWIDVKPGKDAFIINVGDVIQVWSNDKYESVEHRAKANPSRERLSIPFFFSPSHYVMVKPLDELIDKDNPAKYKEYNFGKFYSTRRLSDFKKLDVENIQIHHFRIAE